MQLVLATQNIHKIREFRHMMHAWNGVDLLTLLNFQGYVPPEENGKTFMKNAELKAVHAAQSLKKWVIADDSGLVVPALNGSPGVFSRRYSGEDATDSENRQKLLLEMESFEGLKRAAYYECDLALASPEGKVVKTTVGICEGMISTKERGSNGFGYDSIFIKNDYDKTFAQLDESIKNLISHRRKALDKLLNFIERLKNQVKEK